VVTEYAAVVRLAEEYGVDLAGEYGLGTAPTVSAGHGRSHALASYQRKGTSTQKQGQKRSVWECQDKRIFQESCGHENWEYSARPCGSWSCEPCRTRRVMEEIVPEVAAALRLARKLRVTLKHVVITWPGDSVAAEDSPAGAAARAKHIAALWQMLRKKNKFAHWLKVAESHKSGKIHFHFLVIMPGFPRDELVAFWEKLTGANQLWIESTFLKCPKCWQHGIRANRQQNRKIVPWPGSGKCGNCGYKIKGQDYESIIRGIAAEASKYLGKQMAMASKHKKLTRSKGWPALADDKPEKVKCVECDSFHVYKRIGEVAGHVKVKLAEIEGAHVAYYPTGGQPCHCFDRGGGNPRFRESVSVSPEGALADMAVGYHSAADGSGCDCGSCLPRES